jgi:hypothetical protein
VVLFWDGLTDDASASSRAGKLHDFFFQGLPGFAPVVSVASYGGGPSGLGQIRSNELLSPPWMEREFKMKRDCSGPACTLRIVPAPAQANPFFALFAPTPSSPLAGQLQTELLAALPQLIVKDAGDSCSPRCKRGYQCVHGVCRIDQ